MLVIVTTIVKHFEISLPQETVTDSGGKTTTTTQTRICRKPSVIMMPMVEGQIGAWMGLVLKPLD